MFVWLVHKLLFLMFFFFFFLLFIVSRLTKKKKKNKTKKKQWQKCTNKKKICRKNPEAVKWISGKHTKVYCRCTCHWLTLVLGIRKAWPPPIRACKTDGLPKASMAELLVTKQDPNSCDRVGLKSHKFGGNVSKLLKYCWLGRYITIHAVDSEVKRGLKSNSVRSGQPTYETYDDNLDARI